MMQCSDGQRRRLRSRFFVNHLVFWSMWAACVRAFLLTQLLSVALATTAQAGTRLGKPGPGKCHRDCSKYGNCGEDGECRCPFGRLGKGCEIDFLGPCRQGPDSLPYCGTAAAKSCECFKRCHEYWCRQDSKNETVCEWLPWPPIEQRGCYVREGVEPDKQYSLVPEEDEQGVKYYQGFVEGAAEVNRTVALQPLEGNADSIPLSRCKHKCHMRGYCLVNRDDPAHNTFCSCHRGFAGESCEVVEDMCYLKCNGRGKCVDQFCHCKPPYFSIGCSRSKVYPPNYSRPSPVNFKIYMYELNTRVAYDNVHYVGWQGHDPIYTAFQHFMEQFLLSPVRTEDPSEANLFYIPAFQYSYSGNVGVGAEHLHMLLEHIQQKWPYWNRTQGRDHFFWATADRGACFHFGLAEKAMRIVHFGLYLPEKARNETRLEQGFDWLWDGISSKDYGCYSPFKDVVSVPYEDRATGFLVNTRKLTLDELLGGKERLFFFAGDVRMGDPEYSGLTRQLLYNLTQKWNDTEFMFVYGGVDDYETTLRKTKFCLAVYGHGWGIRIVQAAAAGCVPVIIQEHVYQPFEEVLPYESFSLRLNNADLPHMREILHGVTEQQYRRLLENLLRYQDAWSWDTSIGGRAFDYTIATLRRRYMALKSLYY